MKKSGARSQEPEGISHLALLRHAKIQAEAKARWAKIRQKGFMEQEGLTWPRPDIKIERRGYHECLRCNYRWLGRESFQGDRGLPKRCPSCRSPLWNTPRRNAHGQGRPKLYVVTKFTSCS